MPPSPSGSESSGRLSSPLDTNASGVSHPSVLHHSRMNMSSPVNNGPLELTRGHPNGGDGRSKDYDVGMTGHNTSGDSSNNVGGRDDHHPNSHHPSHLPPPPGHHHPGSHSLISGENGMVQSSNKLQDAMKMAAMLSQGGPNGQANPPVSQASQDLRNLIHHQNPEMMSPDVRMQAEALLRSQAEALRLAVENHNSSNNNNNNAKGNNNSHSNHNGGSSPNSANNNNSSGHNGPTGEIIGNHMNAMISQHAQPGHHPAPGANHVSNGHGGHHRIPDHHRMDAGLGQPGNLPHSMANPHHLHHSHPALNHHPHQLNSILSQQSDLSEALMRLDARTLGFPLPAHNS